MADVQQESPMIIEQWFGKFYVNDLKSHFTYCLGPLRPTSINDTYWLTINLEKGEPLKAKNYQGASSVKTSTGFQKSYTTTADKPTNSRPPSITQRA